MKSTVKTAIIVLAAGASHRMVGRNKLLADLDGKPMIRHVAETAVASIAMSVIVVTGCEAERIERELGELSLSFTHNPDFAKGMSTSLQSGLAALDDQIEAVLIMLGDMPEVSTELLDLLMEQFEKTDACKICLPVSQGKRGNPVLLPRWLFSELALVEGDKGARGVIAAHADEVVEVHIDSPAIHHDIDTFADLETIRQHRAREE